VIIWKKAARDRKSHRRIMPTMRENYRMTPRQFRKAAEAGVFGERRLELLGGMPFVMSENPPHIFASIRVDAALRAIATAPLWLVSKNHRIELGQWLPLPDAVDLNRRLAEVRTLPFGKGKNAGYARCEILQERDLIPVVLNGSETGQIAVADLLP
jgi:hypothetical protein